MGKKLKPAKGAQKRVQAVVVTGTPPDSMVPVVGLFATDGNAAIPDNVQHVASTAYSLGSPNNGAQRIAVLNYSLGSTNLPGGLKRVVILPET